jgi:Sel1 repeat
MLPCMSSKRWLGAIVSSMCLVNCVLAGSSGRGTVSSPDGDVQIQTDYPSGKVTILRPTDLEMQAIHKKADDGDASAQMIISEVQYALKNLNEGERWLRKSAQKGNIFAEYTLGAELTFGLRGGAPRPEEGIIWLKLAACEGYPGAQEELADCYRRGLGVEKDELEGYGWFLISLRSWPSTNKNSAKLQARYEQLLSSTQIERAKIRAKNFIPAVTDKNPFVDAGMIKLKAISESNGKPIVLINDQAFTIGEQKKVTWVGNAIEMRCLEIRGNSVIIATEPYWQRGELRSPK